MSGPIFAWHFGDWHPRQSPLPEPTMYDEMLANLGLENTLPLGLCAPSS